MKLQGYIIVSKAGFAYINNGVIINEDNPTVYSTIGEAMKVASEVNASLGTPTFKVWAKYSENVL